MRNPFTLNNLFLAVVALAFVALVTGCTTPCQGDPSKQCGGIDWGSVGLGGSIGGFF